MSLDEDDTAALERVVGYYHECLKRSPAALAYLEKRGIADPAAIDAFKLGFSDRTLGLRLPDKRRREGAELRARLERSAASGRGDGRGGHARPRPGNGPAGKRRSG